jgi:FHA domain
MTDAAQVEPKHGNSWRISIIAQAIALRWRAGYGRSRVIAIVISEGPRAGERLPLDREMTVGRAGVDLTLNDHQVSRRHLVLKPNGDDLHVEDLGSKNGTLVNGQRITGTVQVPDGSVISLGTCELIVQITAPPDPTTPLPAPAPTAAGSAEMAPTGLPAAFWTVTTLVEIGLILTAATLLVYYAVR